MILFKCQKCSAVLDAEDAYTGCQVACTYCGTEQVVPGQSDPACVLIFTEESPATGTPMTAAELNVRVSEGSVRPYDLIWADGMWQPLCAVFEMGVQPSADAQPASNADEIAVCFDELEPLPGMERLPRLRRKGGQRNESFVAPSSPSSTTSSISCGKVFKAIAAAAVVVAGIFCGLKIFNSTDGRAAKLLIFNGTAETVHVSAPWAHCDASLMPLKYLAVGKIGLTFGGSKKLSYTSNLGSDVQTDLTVNVAPKDITLVNIGGSQFPVMTPSFSTATFDKWINSKDDLLLAIQKSEPPTIFADLCEMLDTWMKDMLKEYSAASSFTEKHYRLDLLAANTGSGIKSSRDNSTQDARPVVLPHGAVTLISETTNSSYLFETMPLMRLHGSTMTLDGIEVNLASTFKVNGNAMLYIAREDSNDLKAIVQCQQMTTAKYNGQSINGKWCYTAACVNGTWEWKWELFDNNGKVRITIDKAGEIQTQ